MPQPPSSPLTSQWVLKAYLLSLRQAVACTVVDNVNPCRLSHFCARSSLCTVACNASHFDCYPRQSRYLLSKATYHQQDSCGMCTKIIPTLWRSNARCCQSTCTPHAAQMARMTATSAIWCDTSIAAVAVPSGKAVQGGGHLAAHHTQHKWPA